MSERVLIGISVSVTDNPFITHARIHGLTTHVIFWLNTLKGTAIILTPVILDFSTLSGTNLQILTFKRYDEHHLINS